MSAYQQLRSCVWEEERPMPRQRPNPPRQRRYEPLAVLAYIARYQQQNIGHSPSQRRIQRDLNISAPSVVHTMLHRLARSNLLTITTHGRGRAADLALTEAGQKAAAMWREDNEADKGPAS